MNNAQAARAAEKAELKRKQRRCLYCVHWVAPALPIYGGECMRLDSNTPQHACCSMFEPLPDPEGWR